MDGMCPRPDSGGGPVNYARVDSGGAELLRDADRAAAWMLLVDGTPQSYVDLEDPRYLEFEYVRRLGHLIDLAAEPGEPLRVLHLGAGGLTLARYVIATRPRSSQVAVEADAALVAFVRERLPLNQPPRRTGQLGRVRIRIGDAREVLGQLPAGSFDLVLADLFCGGRTPAHLTSIKFTQAAARVLTADGVFAVNVGDGPPLAHARARVATAQQVFPPACLIADGDLDRFVAGAKPITDADAEPSPAPPSEIIMLRPAPQQEPRQRREAPEAKSKHR